MYVILTRKVRGTMADKNIHNQHRQRIKNKVDKGGDLDKTMDSIIDLFIDRSLLLCPPCKIMKELYLNHSTTVYRLCCLCKALLLQ